jgi:hypothetical protein
VSELPAELRDAARADIAQQIERESFARAFSSLAKKNRLKKNAAARALYNAKVEKLREWKPGETDETYAKWASRSTTKKIDRMERDRETESHKLIRRGKNKGMYQKISRVESGPNAGKAKKVGKPISRKSMRQRVRRAGQKARLTALKQAFGLRTLKEARHIDRRLLEVPDRLRKRIYDSVVSALEREYADELLARAARGEKHKKPMSRRRGK